MQKNEVFTFLIMIITMLIILSVVGFAIILYFVSKLPDNKDGFEHE